MHKHLRALLLATPLLGLVAVGLSACGEPDPGKLNQQIDKGDYAAVISKLDAAIEASPTSPVYHLLAVRAALLRCAHEQSFCDNLGNITPHLNYTTTPVSVANGPMSLGSVLDSTLPEMAKLPQQPAPLLGLLKVFPSSRRNVLADSLLNTAGSLFMAGDVSTSNALLIGLSNTDNNTLPDSARTWAGALGYLNSTDTNMRQSYFISLKSRTEPALSRAALGVAPAAVFNTYSGPSATALFTNGLSATLAGWNTPLLKATTAGVGVAEGLNRMRTSPAFLARAITTWPGGGSVVTDLSPSVALDDPGVALQLALSKLSLMYNPNQPALLADFLNLATRAMQKNGQADLLSDLSFESLPAEAQAALVEKLFTLLEQQQAAKQPLAPLLLPIASMKLDKASSTRLEKLLQTALEQAVAGKQASTVLAIATARPTLAQNNRQIIAPLLVDDIRDHLKARDFSTVTDVAAFLTGKLNVSFNLDTLILEGLADDFKTNDTAKSLSANDATWLLKTEADAKFDLGPYWHFVQDHFAAKPAIINSQLRALVGNASGNYGAATAMWRLSNEFEDSEFSAADRNTYTNKAIQSALLADTSLSPGQMLDSAGRLAQYHPDLPLAPIVEAALKRATTLDESRAIWAAATPSARQVITSVRPQFASLMRGVDAFNGKRLTAAAAEFSRITDVSYRDQLLPYFDELQKHLAAATGVYVNTNASSTVPVAVIIVEAPALYGGDKNTAGLTDLRLTMVNRLGTQTETDSATLGTTRGAVRSLQLASTLDFGTNSSALGSAMAEPTSLPQPNAELFGPLENMAFEKDGLSLRVNGQKQPVKLLRLLANPAAVLLPQGRYQLTSPITAPSAILPAGTLLEIETENTPSGAVDNVYAMHVLMKHPGLNTAQDLDGRYDTITRTFTANFKVPLRQGGMAGAALKCQLLGNSIVCGAHYLNQPRQAYINLIGGAATRESVAAQAARLQTANEVYAATQHGINNPLFARLTKLPDAPSATEISATRPKHIMAVTEASTTVISSSAMGFGGALTGIDAPPAPVPAEEEKPAKSVSSSAPEAAAPTPGK
ncbi:MAG TPA: hypothetical protein VHP58_03745 [Alphaproteobacteria bacterium]|nr:hypothetical protein [Alphaproteobacteria bacterium]